MRQAFLGLLALFCGAAASAQFPQPYCAETYPGGVSPITRVQLGTIDNATPVSPAGPAHEDFTGQSTTLLSGNKYTITVAGPAEGNSIAYFRVSFDWNGDNDFADSEETIPLGGLMSSTGVDGKAMSATFTVPFAPEEGPVRMRVAKKVDNNPWPCNTGGIGQTEDYTVVVNYPPPVSVYVNAAATGLNNGSSWTHAYTSLVQAIDSMRPRDTLKVAAGTYTPGQSETSSFRLKEGTVLLGGYPATGNPTDAQRDFSRYPTILSGVFAPPSTSPPYAFNRSYHVLRLEGVTDKTIVDGVMIEGGRADGNSYNSETDGGGVYITGAHPIFRNCVWRNNQAWEGTAIACLNGSNPTFVNCFVVQNNDYGSNSTVRVTGNSHPRFINTVFWRNTGTTVYATGSTATLTNCSFVNNYLGSYTYQPRAYSIYAEDQSAVAVRNSIFFNNGQSLNTDSTDIFLNLSTAQVEATITQVYHSGAAPKQYQNPRFRDTASITGPDGLYFTGDDGLQLVNPCSPALNAGSNTAVTAGTDMLGRPRIFGAAVDLGAYEVQEAPLPVPSVIYVDSAATGRGDGSSWANAYTDLQQAFQACSDTIKVAAGTYYPSRDNPVISLWLESGRTLLGGYPSGGAASDGQRDPALHKTSLSGRLPASGGKHSLVVLRGRFVDSTAVVDGVTIQAAAVNYPGQTPYSLRGGVLLTHGSAPLFRHCVLRNEGGGALRISGQSRPTFRQTVFENQAPYNTQITGVTSEDRSAPRFIGCVFRGTNTPQLGESSLGCAMVNMNARPYIDSCLFINNGACTEGSAIHNNGGSHTVIRNTIFSGNYATGYGNDLYNHASVVEVFNCTFDSPEQTRYGGAVANVAGARATFTQCRFRNGYTDWNGGAVYNDFSEATFLRCVFSHNRAYSGGALSNVNGSTARLTNCVVVENKTRYASAISSSKSVLSITHCTFMNNRLLGYDHSALIHVADSSETTVRNSVFYDNDLFTKTNADIIAGGNACVVTVANSLMKFYGTHGENGNIVGRHPRLVNNLDPDGPDDIFFTEDDGAALSPCSPAIEAGDNAWAAGIDRDVLEKERQYGSWVDMGAYEFRGTRQQPRDYYVKANATGSGTGLSWQDAYTSLQKGLCEPCADTLRVAAGVYMPAASARDSSFIINQRLAVVGGYGEDGSRDPFTHLTILSGNIGNPTDSLDNSHMVLGIPAIRDTVLLDGLVIRDGNKRGGSVMLNAVGGAGLLTTWNHTIIRNSQFINNRAAYGGGLHIATYGTCELSRSIFSGNSASNAAGALYMEGDSLDMSGCVFEYNYAYGEGGAINIQTGWPGKVRLGNSVFYRNFTSGTNSWAVGGAVFFHRLAAGTVFNCSFLENRTTLTTIYSGGGLYFDHNLSVRVSNSVFKGNMAGSSDSTVGADLDWRHYNLVNKCFLQTQREYTLDANIAGKDPGFIDYTTPKGKDSRWLTTDDGLRLNYNAPVINYGLNEAVASTPHDILGRQRITGTAVDGGAYEHDGRLIAYAGPHREICPGSTTRLGITGNPAHTYSWTAQPAGFTSTEATPVVTPSDNTTYYLEVSDGSTTLRDTVVVTIDRRPRPTVSIAASAAAVCKGASLSFTATPANAGSITAYRWLVNGVLADSRVQFTTTTLNNGDEVKLQIVVPTCAGIDTVSSNTVAAVITALPVANAGRDTTICSGTSVTLGAPALAGHTYAWTGLWNGTTGMSSTTVAQPVLTPTGAGSYIVAVTSPAGCTGRDTVFVGVSPSPGTPTITANGATTICQGASVTLSASTASAYQWYRDGAAIAGATGRQLTTITGGSYTVGIPGGACVPTSAPITVTVKPTPPKPTISVSGNTLTSSASGGNQWYKDWAPISGATAQTYTATAGGIYAVQVTQNGCSTLSDTLSLVTTGISGPSAWNGEVLAYPNPVERELFIRNTAARRLSLQLLDGFGRIVYEGKLSATAGVIPMQGLPAGVCQLLVTDEKKKETIRITVIKQ